MFDSNSISSLLKIEINTPFSASDFSFVMTNALCHNIDNYLIDITTIVGDIPLVFKDIINIAKDRKITYILFKFQFLLSDTVQKSIKKEKKELASRQLDLIFN